MRNFLDPDWLLGRRFRVKGCGEIFDVISIVPERGFASLRSTTQAPGTFGQRVPLDLLAEAIASGAVVEPGPMDLPSGRKVDVPMGTGWKVRRR